MEKKALSKSLCVVLSATLLPVSSGAVIAGEIAQKNAAKAHDLASVAVSDKDKVFSVNCLEKSKDTITVSWSDILSDDNGSYSVYVDAFPVKENLTDTSYTLTDLPAASKHNIYVKALSATGETVETSENINVSTDLVIDSTTALWSDQTVGDVYITNNASLNLNGHTLNVKGNVYVSYGTLKIGGGTLIVDGDLRIQETNTASDGNKTYSPCYSYFVMNDENDSVIVKGSFYDASRYTHEGYLTNGTLSIYGDFVQISGSGSNFFATGNHRTILSGNSLQNVDLESSGTHFAILELENFTEEGVFFNKPISADEFIQNGCKVSFQDSGILGWTLNDDYTYTGDLNLLGDTLDLNGHTLTVTGDLTQSGGVIKVNGGELKVEGSYKIATADNGSSSGILDMTDKDDRVTVIGDFETRSTADHSKYLTAGVMSVGGNFVQHGIYSTNFKTSGTHKIVLNGTSKQNVAFDSHDSGYSNINELEITNSSAEGVEFKNNTYVVKKLYDTDAVVAGSARMILGSNAELADGKWSYDLSVNSKRTLSDDWNISGSLYIADGTFDVNGKKLTVGKDIGINSGTLYVNGGTVETGKDLWLRYFNVSSDGTVVFNGSSYGYLKMTNENDFVKVNGSFVTDAVYSHDGYLTNGILEVKGNFTQMRSNENFKATNEHKVVLSGVKQQRISFESNTSKFNILEVNKPLNTGYIFSRTPLWETLIETEKDSEAPTAPSDLSSDIQTATSIKLNWKKSTDNNEVVGYDVYRNGVRIGNSTGTSFVDERLKSNTAYTYYVVAYDTMRNESDWSNIIQAKTLPDENAPTQPTDLKVKKQSDSAVTFSWTASEDNTEVKGYDVYRNNVLIGTVNGTSFTDNAIAAGLYKYYVKAFDDTNNYSVASETLTIDTEAPLPPVLMIDSSDNEKASMSWTCSDNVSVVKYEIYRDGKKIKTLTEDEFTDSELEYDKQYEYHVAAYDAAGNRSKDSNTVTVFTGEDEEPPVVTSIKPGSAVYSKTIPIVIKAKDNAGVSAVVVQSSLDSTEWTDVETVAANGRSTVEVSYDLDISGYDDGAVYVRAIAVDTKGNESSAESALIGSYTVDNTAPKAPANVSVSETKGQLQIRWDDPKDSDVNYFRIYRADSGNDSFEIIADKLETLNYFDTDIELSESYDYYVTAIDYAENESSKSKIVSGGISEDKVKPQVLSVLPVTGTKIPNNRPISISCKDNFRLDSIIVEFAPEGTDLWEQMYSSKLTKTAEIVAFNADMTGMADGKYDVRVKVTDKAGLESDYYTCVYDYKSCSIPEPKLYVTEGGWSVKLNWSSTNDPSLMGYNIYKRSADMTSFELLGSTALNEYTDTNVVAGKTYFYYVEAVDDYCNTISSEKKMAIPTSQDDTVPIADAGSDAKALSNLAFEFDASGSTDNHFINSYKWDFGDGDTSDSMKPTHTYSEPGIYTVGLTVTDSSGNSSTTSINVQVYDDNEVRSARENIDRIEQVIMNRNYEIRSPYYEGH